MKILKKISVLLYGLFFMANTQAMFAESVTLQNLTKYRIYVEAEVALLRKDSLPSKRQVSVCEVSSKKIQVALKFPNVIFKESKIMVRLLIIDYPNKGEMYRLEFDAIEYPECFIKNGAEGILKLSRTAD